MSRIPIAGDIPSPITDKVTISATPVVLSYFAEKQKGSRDDITLAVYDFATKIKNSDLQLDAIFRGALRSPRRGNIQSETVDEEIGYWLSNHFLKECNISPGESICFEVNKSDFIENYKIDRIKETMSDMDWKNEHNKTLFFDSLKEAICSDR